MIRTRIRMVSGAVLVALTGLGVTLASQTAGYDILIRNGRVLDGTGNPFLYADLAIAGDTIAAVGSLSGASAARTIDARGQYVTPGFIALHEHIEGDVIDGRGALPNFTTQGFTTAVIETASNVVQHGRPAADVPVELGVDLTVSLRRLKAKVIAYNAVEPIVPLDDPSLPADDEESGRGLALIKALVTTLTFERHDETNTWILSKDSSPE